MKTEFYGLKVVEEKEMKCGDCSTPMALIVVSETNQDRINRGLDPQKSKYRFFNCYKCGGSSFFSKTFEGTSNIAPAKESFSLSIEGTDIDPDGTIVSKVKIVRNK